MHRLGPCLTALRVLAKSKGRHRDAMIEKYIDQYLSSYLSYHHKRPQYIRTVLSLQVHLWVLRLLVSTRVHYLGTHSCCYRFTYPILVIEYDGVRRCQVDA